jgi:hypothetical protein
MALSGTAAWANRFARELVRTSLQRATIRSPPSVARIVWIKSHDWKAEGRNYALQPFGYAAGLHPARSESLSTVSSADVCRGVGRPSCPASKDHSCCSVTKRPLMSMKYGDPKPLRVPCPSYFLAVSGLVGCQTTAFCSAAATTAGGNLPANSMRDFSADFSPCRAATVHQKKACASSFSTPRPIA